MKHHIGMVAAPGEGRGVSGWGMDGKVSGPGTLRPPCVPVQDEGGAGTHPMAVSGLLGFLTSSLTLQRRVDTSRQPSFGSRQ